MEMGDGHLQVVAVLADRKTPWKISESIAFRAFAEEKLVLILTQVLIRIRVRLETLADSESSKRSKMTHHKVAAMKSTLLML